MVLADLGLTGMLHLDGLADTADGLLPHLTRERRLEVMREPTVGAFGVGAVVIVLLGRFAVFATLRPAPLLVAALWCTSRTAMAAVVDRVPYARRGEAACPARSWVRRFRCSVWPSSSWPRPRWPPPGRCRPDRWPWRRPRWRSAPWWSGPAGASGATPVTSWGRPGLVAETIGLLVAAARW